MHDIKPTTNGQQPITKPARGRKSALMYAAALLALLGVIAAGIYFFTRERMPDLSHPYTPRADLPKGIQEESAGKVAQAVADLRDDPSLASRWLELAAQFKGIYDYAFAEEIYRYVIRKWPDDVVAYGNLADMYRYEMKRYEDSAVYWKKVVAMKADYIPAYRELHYLYRYNLGKDEATTVGPLEEGLLQNPGNTDLLVPLAYYYRDEKKDYAKARSYFLEARKSANKNGNEKLVRRLDSELAALPQ